MNPKLLLNNLFKKFMPLKISSNNSKEEIHILCNEIKTLNETLNQINKDILSKQDVQVENVNFENLILDKLSFDLGNFDVDQISGALNIGITLNLQTGTLSLPKNLKINDKLDKHKQSKETQYKINYSQTNKNKPLVPKINRIC